jgi:PAS domain S-box-containing protein/putative nucleotidyltransferase with HDIG domain
MKTIYDSSADGITEEPGLLDQLEALLNSNADGLALTDARGAIIRTNKALTAITGYSEEEVLGRHLETLDIFGHAATADLLHRFIVALSGQPTSPFTVKAFSRKGAELDLEIDFSAWRRTDHVAGVIATVREVADSSSCSSYDSAEGFRYLVETTSDWVWETNDRGVYTYASPRVTDILGYDPHEVVGKSQFDFMPLQDARKAVETMAIIVSSQKPIRLIHVRQLHKDGHSVLLETSGNPYFGPDGELLGYRGIHRDITERRKAEEEVRQTYHKLESTVDSVIEAMALTVEMRDCYTAGHQARVKKLAGAIAREMRVPAERIQAIRVAALLHDLGKIFVPVEILTKPGGLNEMEFAMIKTHPQAAYDILKNIEFPWPIADVVFQHHERLDGSGYPLGLHGTDIVTEARILAVSDVVEAMTFHRAYRPALGLDAALREIVRKKESLYDPKVVEACLNVFLDHGFAW